MSLLWAHRVGDGGADPQVEVLEGRAAAREGGEAAVRHLQGAREGWWGAGGGVRGGQEGESRARKGQTRGKEGACQAERDG